MRRIHSLLSAAILLTGTCAKAQDSTSITPTTTVSAYLEPYYSYDFNRQMNNVKAPFLYNHTRNNEVNLNLALVKVNHTSDRMRANFAIAAGTYMNANYSAEPGVLKNIYEANAGIKLSAKSDLWLDAGIMPAHIGWESAIGRDNFTLSRSLSAENSPYFETGVKVGYTTKNGKWYLSALVLNGWQRIQRVDGNTTPSFGTQVTFKPSASVSLNSSTFIGNDKPDSARRMRYFHDLYAQVQLGSRWAAIAGFDIGGEQKAKGSKELNVWYTPVLIIKYTASSRTSFSARGEYFRDKNGVIIATGTPNGFNTWGYSANVDYTVTKNVVWRTEVRNLVSDDSIFTKQENKAVRNAFTVSMALAISF